VFLFSVGYLCILIFFSDYNHNVILVIMTFFPGILPFVPLILPNPKIGLRWMYIFFAVTFQFFFSRFDLMWGNISVMFTGSVGMSLLYYSLAVRSVKCNFLMICSCFVCFVCFLFLFLLCRQVYLYNDFLKKGVCFNYEEYCGSSCYKDYNKVSCDTNQWQADVFHGAVGSSYRFITHSGYKAVIFKDNNKKVELFLTNEGLERK